MWWILGALGLWAFRADILGGLFSLLLTGFRDPYDDFGQLYGDNYSFVKLLDWLPPTSPKFDPPT
jgi:hypothetical protein